MSEELEAGRIPAWGHPWEKVISRILLGLMYFGMIVMISLMMLTVVHATGRYAFNTPIEGLVELSCFMLVMIIFCSGPYTEIAKAHIVIGTLVDRFSARTQAIIDAFSYLLSLALTLIACYYTMQQAIYYIDEDYTSLILSIPHYPFVFFLAFGWLMLGLAITVRLIHFFAVILGRTPK